MSLLERRITDLFAHDVHRTIEEVIKVDQTNEEVVAGEIREYVTTDKIRADFTRILDKYEETPQKPHEGIGIWISGFFGSGKSSFAKILGYVLENRVVQGHLAADLFLKRLPGAGSEELTVLLRAITAKVPTSTIIFDVSTDRSVKTGSERITAIMYKAVLRELGYAQDFNLAELEINLESEGRLAEFEATYERIYRKSWKQTRALITVAVGQASRVMSELDPETYPAADSWAKGMQKIDVDTDPNRFADRVFDLMKRRREGRNVVFVIDEVGQYVARSTDKMLDLQGVVQALGAKGRGRAWVAVTSQERLEEIVSSLDQTRIELARLRDRFPIRVDLVAADIAEVTSTRVLAKKGDFGAELERLYEGVKGQLTTFTRLDGTARYPALSAQGFARLYPFLPYQIDLIIDVISGLRLQAGGSTHTGGSSRTIIKLAQQVLIHDRVGIGRQQVGPLVTLDRIYDLIEQFVTPERRHDINRITRDFPEAEFPLVGKVAKAICLLEQVKNIKRTPATLSAVLHPSVTASALIGRVQDALETLKTGQWVEETEEGWELLSPQGKAWAQERTDLALPSEPQYTRYKKTLLEELLRSVKDYRHKGHRAFRPSIQFGGEVIGNAGDIEVDLLLIDRPRWDEARIETVERSRETNKVFWLAPVDVGFYRELEEYHRSLEMLAKYRRDAKNLGLEAQVDAENRRLERHTANAKNRLGSALMNGDTYFHGIRREATVLSDQLPEVLQKLFAQIVPVLYPKFDLAAVSIKESDIPRIIEDRSLGALPEVYYPGTGRLGLVVKEAGGSHKPNADAEIAAEVLTFISRNYRPPERVTGKAMLEHFRGLGFGWDPEPVRLVAATLLRAGKIDVISGGMRIQSYTDPGAREAFTTLPAFRGASFAPKTGGVTWEELVIAGEACERLFGEDVSFTDAAAVASALKGIFHREQTEVHAVQTRLYQGDLRGTELLEKYLSTFGNIVRNSTDDLVLAFLGELSLIEEGHELAVRLKMELVPSTLTTVKTAREDVKVVESGLTGRTEMEAIKVPLDRLKQNLRSERWFEALPDIKTDHATVVAHYVDAYMRLHRERAVVYRHAVDAVKGHPKWVQLTDTQQKNVLFALESRIGSEPVTQKVPANPTIREMEAHLEGVHTQRTQAIFEIERLTAAQEEPKIHRVRVATIIANALDDKDALEEALERLRTECLKVLEAGGKVMFE